MCAARGFEKKTKNSLQFSSYAQKSIRTDFVRRQRCPPGRRLSVYDRGQSSWFVFVLRKNAKGPKGNRIRRARGSPRIYVYAPLRERKSRIGNRSPGRRVRAIKLCRNFRVYDDDFGTTPIHCVRVTAPVRVHVYINGVREYCIRRGTAGRKRSKFFNYRVVTNTHGFRNGYYGFLVEIYVWWFKKKTIVRSEKWTFERAPSPAVWKFPYRHWKRTLFSSSNFTNVFYYFDVL